MAHFDIDGRISRLAVKVAAAGALSVFGHHPTIVMRGLSGELEFDKATYDHAQVRFRASATDLDVQDAGSDADRQEIERLTRDRVLETAKFPAITFESTAVVVDPRADGPVRLQVQGRLALHGVTRPVTLPTQVSLTGTLLRANGEFSIRQTDFNITPVTVAGGVLKVKDELRCAFDIVAREQG